MKSNITCHQGLTGIVLSVLLLYNSFHLPAQNIELVSFISTNGSVDSVYHLNSKISLNYTHTHIHVTYRDLSDSTGGNYMYRLMGLDDRWYKQGNRTSVNYVNLLGGQYELQVKNVNFPHRVARVQFQVDEAFWQHSWFVPALFAYVLLIASLILYFIRTYRLRNQIRLHQIREEIASDLHDDVGTTLSSVAFLSELARSKFDKKPEEVRVILEKMMVESKEMIQTMRGTVWTITPHNDKANDFFDKVKSFCESLLSTKLIQLTFTLTNVENIDLKLETQRNLFLIFKETIVNIGRHSGATAVKIFIQGEKNHYWILISDNGNGFDPHTVADGNGLRNIKTRALQIGGDLAVESTIGEGTQIKMVIPIP